MPSSNILLFDANKANMMSDEQYNTNTQRLNGVQSGIASSQLQNKTLYQVSLVAYAIAQIMNQNGLDANDTAAVSAFVANLSGTMLQKVADLASTQEAQAGVATGKWMSPALVKAAMDAYTSNKWLPLTGGTMKGNLILNTSSPTNDLQAASKGYVDNSIKLKQVLNKTTFNTPNKALQMQFVEEYTDASIIFLYFTGTGQGNVLVGNKTGGDDDYISFYVNGRYKCISYLLVNTGDKVFAPNKSSQQDSGSLYSAAIGIDLKSTIYIYLKGTEVTSVTAEAFAIM